MNQELLEESLRIRVEKYQIKPNHPCYKVLDNLCFKAKNVYNTAIHAEKKAFFKKDPNLKGITYLNSIKLCQYIKNEPGYKELPSYISQSIAFRAASTFKSFLRANYDYSKNPSKYSGRPRPPRYKDSKNGRYVFSLTYNAFGFNPKNPKEITFNHLLKKFKVKTRLNPEKHKLQEARFIPHKTHITLEIVYLMKEKIPETPEDFKYIAGIDVGIDNFSTISILKESTSPLIINGKGLKSYNKYFNKKLAHLKSEAMTKHKKQSTKRIERLFKKRNNYIENWIHNASRTTVKYLYENKVKAVVIGKNKNWKQNSKLFKKVNQTFIQIPYAKYIEQLIYKCEDLGITVSSSEEAYTSGTSYLDNESPIKEFYDKYRRIHRGLFKSNEGRLINTDVNAAFQITKKAFKTNYKDSYKLKINPLRVNVA